MSKIKLAEEPYVSIQGEGQFVGLPMLFLRTQGCDVGCEWCDSYYTWAEKTTESFEIEIPKLASQIKGKSQRIWLTGGEPLMYYQQLCELIDEVGTNTIFHICTSGLGLYGKLFEKVSYITLDVKPPSANVKSEDVLDLAYLIENYGYKMELKTAISSSPTDKQFAINLSDTYDYMPLTIQPTYVSEPLVNKGYRPKHLQSWLSYSEFADWVSDVFWTKRHVRMGLQLHKHLYQGSRRI